MRTEEQLIEEIVYRLSNIQDPTPEKIRVVAEMAVREIKDQYKYEITHHQLMANNFAKELRRAKADLEDVKCLTEDPLVIS